MDDRTGPLPARLGGAGTVDAAFPVDYVVNRLVGGCGLHGPGSDIRRQHPHRRGLGGPRFRPRLPARHPVAGRAHPGMVQRMVRRVPRFLLLFPVARPLHSGLRLVSPLRGGFQNDDRGGFGGPGPLRLFPGALHALQPVGFHPGRGGGGDVRLYGKSHSADLRGNHRLHAGRRVHLLVGFRPVLRLSGMPDAGRLRPGAPIFSVGGSGVGGYRPLPSHPHPDGGVRLPGSGPHQGDPVADRGRNLAFRIFAGRVLGRAVVGPAGAFQRYELEFPVRLGRVAPPRVVADDPDGHGGNGRGAAFDYSGPSPGPPNVASGGRVFRAGPGGDAVERTGVAAVVLRPVSVYGDSGGMGFDFAVAPSSRPLPDRLVSGRPGSGGVGGGVRGFHRRGGDRGRRPMELGPATDLGSGPGFADSGGGGDRPFGRPPDDAHRDDLVLRGGGRFDFALLRGNGHRGKLRELLGAMEL